MKIAIFVVPTALLLTLASSGYADTELDDFRADVERLAPFIESEPLSGKVLCACQSPESPESSGMTGYLKSFIGVVPGEDRVVKVGCFVPQFSDISGDQTVETLCREFEVIK